MQYEIEKLEILIEYADTMDNVWLSNHLKKIVKQLKTKQDEYL